MFTCTSILESYKLVANNCGSNVIFYSQDRELNNEIALCYARSFVCQKNCGVCHECLQFNHLSHPDVIVLNQETIKVEDVSKIIDKISTRPVNASFKIFVILNAEVMNEIAQNKLLKSLEESCEHVIFILTTSKLDKILPTVLSRLNKIQIPFLSENDKKILSKCEKSKNINFEKYLNKEITLTNIINYETKSEYKDTLNSIINMFENLNSSKDIPSVSSSLANVEKNLFFPVLSDLVIDCLKDTNIFDFSIKTIVKYKFNKNVLMKILPIINDSYKKFQANVNFNYILDNLLYKILKEKFLCN